jgi:hypothetical protein
MATYTPGDNEDHVIKSDLVSEDLDLTQFIAAFKQIKAALQEIPDEKTTPDQETLDYWTAVVYIPGQDDKKSLDDKAVELYNEVKPVKDAGLLPSKYDDEYQQLESYVNSL